MRESEGSVYFLAWEDQARSLPFWASEPLVAVLMWSGTGDGGSEYPVPLSLGRDPVFYSSHIFQFLKFFRK